LQSARAGVLTYWAAALLAAGAGGFVATRPYAPRALLALAAVIAVAALLERCGVGCAIGLLILGCLDALPGPNLETLQVAATIKGQDVVVAVLVLLLAFENARERFYSLRHTRWGAALACWSLVFLAWWAFTAARTWLSTDVPLLHAAFWARDFAYFAILLPLLFAVLRRRSVRRTVLITVAVGAVVAGLAQSAVVVAHSHLTFIVHTYMAGEVNGLTRLYTSASDIPFAALPLGLGLLLFGGTLRRRLIGAVLAAISLVAVLIGLTRAIYVGEVAGLGLATALWLARPDAVGRVGRRQLIAIGLVGAVAAGMLVAYTPATLGTNAINGVSSRVVSLETDLSGTSPVDASLEDRNLDYARLEQLLGGHWLIGLGFLDPSFDYVPGLPQGSIRNSDVGVFNTLETMGLIGTGIYALPLLALLVALARHRLRARRRSDEDWLAYGALAWAIAALATSATLTVFFNPAEVVGAATMLALAAVVVSSTRSGELSA
jgi:hypothetical protein